MTDSLAANPRGTPSAISVGSSAINGGCSVMSSYSSWPRLFATETEGMSDIDSVRGVYNSSQLHENMEIRGKCGE